MVIKWFPVSFEHAQHNEKVKPESGTEIDPPSSPYKGQYYEESLESPEKQIGVEDVQDFLNQIGPVFDEGPISVEEVEDFLE